MKVRRAAPEDFAWIAGQLREFASSLNTKHSYIPESDESLHAEIEALSKAHVLLVAVADDGALAGTIGGLLVAHPYNPAIVTLHERFWWVPAPRRGSRAAYLLLRDFLAEGERVANVTVISLEHNSAATEKSLARLGLRFQEASYVKES